MLASKAVPSGTSWTQLYAAPATGIARVPVEAGLTNTTGADIAVGLAVTTTSTAPTAGVASPASDTVAVYEFARPIGPSSTKGNGPLTRSLLLLPGQYVWVQASAAGVAATLDGFAE